MRVGFNLPHSGPAASPENIVRVAKRAEELAYDSLWVWERLLLPTDPQTPYPGTPDGSYPEVFRSNLDPLDALTFAAAHTSRVTLGTSVINLPYYNPVVLARRITTLDVLSNGRARLGLGLAWSKDELDATGAEEARRGARADEFLTLLKSIWTSDPVEFHGDFYELPKSIIQPKPVQKPHPPIYLGTYNPAGLKRAATLANGWTVVGIPLDGMQQMIPAIRSMAKEAGRENEVEVNVRANFHLTDQPMGEGRFIFYGSLDEIKSDVDATRDLGVEEIFFDPSFSPDGLFVDGFLQRMEQLRELV